MSVGLCLCSATVLLQQLEVAQLRETLAGLAGGVSPCKESQAFCEVRNFSYIVLLVFLMLRSCAAERGWG